MTQTLLICESPGQVDREWDRIVYWGSFETDGNALSLPGMVEENAEEFKAKYLTWLYDFGNRGVRGDRIIDAFEIRKGFSFWWMSLLIEKSKWKSPGLYKLFRLMALDLVLQQERPLRVVFSVEDHTIEHVVKGLCRKAGIEFETGSFLKRSRPKSLRQIFNAMPYTIQAALSLVNYLFMRWPIRRAASCCGDSGEQGGITFINYLFNFDTSSADKGRFFSRYWTQLHSMVSQADKVSWIHLYIKHDSVPSSRKAVEIVNRFNAQPPRGHSHSLLDRGLGFSVLGAVVRDYFKMWRVAKRLEGRLSPATLPGSEMDFWPVLAEDWRSSFFGVTAMSNCLYLNLFETVFRQMPHQNKGFYLLENQPWERALIHAWRDAGHGQLVGVQHTTVAYWDLRHFFSPGVYADDSPLSLPIPDRVALNGNAAKQAYLNAGFPSEKAVEVEALRYLYLHAQEQNRSTVNKVKAKRLLVLGDYLPDVTHRQMTLLSKAYRNLPPDVEVLMKAHPACPVDPEAWPGVTMKIVNESLDKIVDDYDIAFASNPTAAAVDAYLAGKKVLVAMDPESFNMSPLRGLAGVVFVATPGELIHFFENNEEDAMYHGESFFHTDPALQKWKAVLGGIE